MRETFIIAPVMSLIERPVRARIQQRMQGCVFSRMPVRPISLLRISLLRLLDSSFPGKFPIDMRIPPLSINILLESNPLKSRILIQRLAVTSCKYVTSCKDIHSRTPVGALQKITKQDTNNKHESKHNTSANNVT